MAVSSPVKLSQIESPTIFELLPGKMLDLQINHPVQVRIKLALVGYEIGRYIIVKYPNVSKLGAFNDVLVEGNVVIVRYILEGQQGECYAFSTTIKQLTQFPDKLIVLEYPQRIENRQLRLHQRIVTHLPAFISLEEEGVGKGGASIQGVIGDISVKGCGFTFQAKSKTVKVNKRPVFVCIKGIGGVDFKIPAYVCNSRNEQGKVNVGVKFSEADKQVLTLLENLLIDPRIAN